MKRSISSIFALLLALALPLPAAQLVLWSFPTPLSGIGNGTPIPPNVDNVAGSPTLTMFNQTIDANGKDGVAYTDSTGVNRPATANGAIAWDDFRGPGADGELRITFNTTGFLDIVLRFDIKENDSSGVGTGRRLLVEYSTDGSTFTTITTFTITNKNTFSARTVPMTAITAVENAPTVIVRLSQGGANDAEALNDSVSFDNVEMTGIPDPTASRPVLTVGAATTTAGRGAPRWSVVTEEKAAPLNAGESGRGGSVWVSPK